MAGRKGVLIHTFLPFNKGMLGTRTNSVNCISLLYMHSTYECTDMQARKHVGIYTCTCTPATSIHSVLPSYTCNSEDGSLFMILFNTTLSSRGLTWCASWTASLQCSLGSTYYRVHYNHCIHVIPETILSYMYIQLQVPPEINV